jgi:hypothetical protein
MDVELILTQIIISEFPKQHLQSDSNFRGVGMQELFMWKNM